MQIATIGPMTSEALQTSGMVSDHLPVFSPAGQTGGSYAECGLNQQLTKLEMITDILLNTVAVFSIQ